MVVEPGSDDVEGGHHDDHGDAAQHAGREGGEHAARWKDLWHDGGRSDRKAHGAHMDKVVGNPWRPHWAAGQTERRMAPTLLQIRIVQRPEHMIQINEFTHSNFRHCFRQPSSVR